VIDDVTTIQESAAAPAKAGRWHAKIIHWNFLWRGGFWYSRAVCYFRTQLGARNGLQRAARPSGELSRDAAVDQDW
jgi:hypothetical protein